MSYGSQMMKTQNPEIYDQLMNVHTTLEKHYRDMQVNGARRGVFISCPQTQLYIFPSSFSLFRFALILFCLFLFLDWMCVLSIFRILNLPFRRASSTFYSAVQARGLPRLR